jgi:hypothetical protein
VRLSAADAIHKLDVVYNGAVADQQFGPAGRAVEVQSKISGLMIDRTEIGGAGAFDGIATMQADHLDLGRSALARRALVVLAPPRRPAIKFAGGEPYCPGKGLYWRARRRKRGPLNSGSFCDFPQNFLEFFQKLAEGLRSGRNRDKPLQVFCRACGQPSLALDCIGQARFDQVRFDHRIYTGLGILEGEPVEQL